MESKLGNKCVRNIKLSNISILHDKNIYLGISVWDREHPCSNGLRVNGKHQSHVMHDGSIGTKNIHIYFD